MNELKKLWQHEEEIAHIKGWDFSYIEGKYNEDTNFGWNYMDIVRKYIKPDMRILDIDTGAAEVLLTLNHPYSLTSCTEGYEPNILLCKERLLPLGIDFKECKDVSNMPFDSEMFDMIINRHGSFDVKELHRLLKKDGIFITQQVGD